MSDLVSAVVIFAAAVFFIWRIRASLRSGVWRLRGGVTYRAKNPKRFSFITLTMCAIAAITVCAMLMMADHQIFCDGKGTPKACLTQTFHSVLGS